MPISRITATVCAASPFGSGPAPCTSKRPPPLWKKEVGRRKQDLSSALPRGFQSLPTSYLPSLRQLRDQQRPQAEQEQESQHVRERGKEYPGGDGRVQL